MALESVFAIAPPLVGEKNKDTKNDEMESSVENEGSDDGLEDEDLEEGEILDSDGEDEADEKSGNAQQPNGVSSQVGAVQSILGNSIKRKVPDAGDQDGTEGILRKNKGLQYIDHDQVLEEDDWTSSITFHAKKKSRFQESLEDCKRKMVAVKRQEAQFSTSDGSPNEDGERRSASPSSLKVKKSRKLGSLCRLKVKKSSGKTTKKRKPESKSRSLRQKRELKHNRPTCKFFMDGKCAKGLDCPFYHPPPHPKKKELCKFYLSGHCAKGKHCLYMHDEFPCKFFHTGAVCYSKDSCRFSHKPLTEESRMLLDRHLHGSSSRQDDDNMDDDYYHERERESKSHERPEVKVKRPCLLGSPPRHIREAAETKQWQEEMKKLQHQSKVSAFEIQVSPRKEISSPSKFSRPNFYTDTLSPSPRRRMPSGDISDSVSSSKSYDVLNQQFPDLSPEDCDNDWTSICDMVNKLSPSCNDMSASEKIVSADQEYIHIKSDERSAPEISEGEHDGELEKSLSPSMFHQDHSSESESSPKQENDKVESPKNRTPVHIPERYPSPEVTAPPINVPSHLPRIQRELFMRIQHNQKKIPSEKSSISKIVPDASEKSESTKTENEGNEPAVKLEDSFYSSEEDDDDQPLTNVLKKLDEKPCIKEPSPPPINIIQQMIKSIGQKASEKPKSSAYHETEAFWQNILSSSAAPVSTPTAVTTSTVKQAPPVIETTPQSPKDSGTPDCSQDQKKGIPELKPSIPRDPRLQNREQRKTTFASFPSPPILNAEENANTFTPLIDPKIGNQFPNKLRDIGTMIQNPTPAVVVEGLQGFGSIPYKLHEVAASPPNYLSYICASNYDRKLLSDPRLRKHIAQGSSTVNQLTLQSKGITLPNIPPPPLTALNSDEDVSGEIVSSASERKAHIIPRTRKMDLVGDPRHVLTSSVHATMSEVMPGRPPPHPVVPSPASHLPRAIADPRLAKLHHPLDPRRPRSMAERNSQRLSERKVAAVIPPKNTPSASVEEKSNPGRSAVESVFRAEAATEAELDGKNTRDAQESGSTILDVCKNRKSNMNYSSPLNSCEDSLSNTTSGYNSYNQRPRRRMPNVPPPVAEVCTPPVNDISPGSPDFAVCDPSSQNGSENAEGTSLKEIFKTKDPAASPFV